MVYLKRFTLEYQKDLRQNMKKIYVRISKRFTLEYQKDLHQTTKRFTLEYQKDLH